MSFLSLYFSPLGLLFISLHFSVRFAVYFVPLLGICFRLLYCCYCSYLLSGVPSHKLELKVGVPVLLMRNLDASRLCNGTRLRITDLRRHIVQATIITGGAKRETVLIPRIPIIPTNLPFQVNRLQFPLKVAFSITINKSQGQTLKVAGIHLATPCFSHGQLYVGCSRVSRARNLYVYSENKKSRNVVYRDVLQ